MPVLIEVGCFFQFLNSCIFNTLMLFPGHPQCLFCEKRFLDEEFRYKHLRKEHFFCQICDADGNSNYFYRYLVILAKLIGLHF